MADRGTLQIGDFVLDPLRNLLTGAEGESALEPKVVDVLLALTAQPGAVLSRDELIDAVWKTEFGADERLTRAISLLRKAFGDERGAARYIETVPKRGYRLVAAVRPVVEGTATDMSANAKATAAPPLPPAGSQEKVGPSPWRRQAVAAAVVAAVMVGVAALATLLSRDGAIEAGYAPDVVRLEPPRAIGGGAENEAFARQMHASLKRILASNQVLLVDGDAAQSGSAPTSTAGEPEFSLSTSVERIGDRYAVDLYFDNRRDRQTLWSHRFVRPTAEAENLRDEASINTAATISCGLRERRAARMKPVSEAFKIYLESCDPTEDLAARLAVAQRLTRLAPNDAYGYGLEALANAFFTLDDLDLSEAELATHRTAARQAIARAFELDAANPLARTAELVLAPPAERWRSNDAFNRASTEHPGALNVYFWMLRSSGRLKEALHVAQRAIRVRGLSPLSHGHLAIVYMQLGEHEQAAHLYEEAVRLWPDVEDLRFYQLVNTAFYGDPKHALKLLEGTKDRWLQACFRAFIEARRRGGGRNEGAAVRGACAGEDDSGSDYLARMMAALSDVDGAYDAMRDKSFDWNGATTFLFYPEMAAFRKDARFMPFIAKSGLLEAWTETGRWPDFCGEQDLPYDCKIEAARVLKDKKERAALNATR